MSEQLPFETSPAISNLRSDFPSQVIEVRMRSFPPGALARPRPDRPYVSATGKVNGVGSSPSRQEDSTR